MTLAEAMTQLRDGWSQEFSDAQVVFYAERLADYDPVLVGQAVDALAVQSAFRPSLAAIVQCIAELALNLPTEEEAWQIAECGSLRDAALPVQVATRFIGGRWAILHSDNPTAVRSQFRQAYCNLRAQALRDYATPRVEVAGLHSRRVYALPVSDRIYPRPMMTRLGDRRAGVIEPPSEEEKSDAIAVLREGWVDDDLYREAERTFAEGAGHDWA